MVDGPQLFLSSMRPAINDMVFRSVPWKYVGELQQRIQTLEALVQQEGDRTDPTSGETDQRDPANEQMPTLSQRYVFTKWPPMRLRP
jgi:hypothetical protein